MNPRETAENNVARQVINRDRPLWTRTEIEDELDLSSQQVSNALASLFQEGVVIAVDGRITASRCARRIERLEMLIPWAW